MPVNISCPACNNRGELPDGTSLVATLSCQACGVRFPVWSAVTPAAVAAPPADDGLAVWVGGAVDRDRVLLDAREAERQAELVRLRAEVAELRAARQRDAAAIAELREQAGGQAETIERMMAAGQRLIKQRDALRAKVRLADRAPSARRAAAPPAK